MNKRRRETSAGPSALAERARASVTEWRQRANLTVGDITMTGLSRSEFHRVLKNTGNLPEDKWVEKLAKLFERINEVLCERGKNPRSWSEIFGADFPEPRLRPDPAMSNYAVLARSKLREVSRPLVEFLSAEFAAAHDQANVWKSSQLLVRLCALYELSAEWEHAAEHFAILEDLNKATGDFHFVADALLRRGVALFYSGRAVEAEVCFRQGLDVIAQHTSKTPPPRTQLRLLNYLAMARSEQGRSDEARQILETRSLPLAQDRASNAAIASVWNRLGIVCLKVGDATGSRDYLVQALQRRTQLGMRSEATKTLLALAETHECLGELPQAIALWRLSVRLQKALSDHDGLARAYFDLGRGYARVPEFLQRTQTTEIRIEFSSSAFPDGRELQALRALAADSPPALPITMAKALSLAEQELETAIIWHSSADSRDYRTLAKRALDGLRANGKLRLLEGKQECAE